jgi:hypothetical protein
MEATEVVSEPKKPKARKRGHYPRKTIAMSIEPDGNGGFQKMMSVTHQNPHCIHKMLPPSLYRHGCRYRTSSGRCRKRLAWGRTVQLDENGRCPGYGVRVRKRNLKEKPKEESK